MSEQLYGITTFLVPLQSGFGMASGLLCSSFSIVSIRYLGIMLDFRRRLANLGDTVLVKDGGSWLGMASMIGHLNGACHVHIPEGNGLSEHQIKTHYIKHRIVDCRW